MNRPAWRTVLVTVAAVTVLAPALAGDTGALRVQDAWIRAAPPGVSVLAGYMTLVNDADRDAVITGASSPSFRMVEMHRSVSEGGVARMVEQDTLTVPARGRLVLEPNGLHLMLMMPAAPLRPGDAVELSLQLADGRSLGITARVRTPGEP
jgi:copper(I)-binding protein